MQRKKQRPQIVVAMLIGFFFSIFAAFFLEYKERVSNDPENKGRFETLKRYANFKLKG